MKIIIKNSIENSMTYIEFKNLVSQLLTQGKSTGKNQSEALLHSSTLSERRMKRLDKTIKLSKETIDVISKIDKKITFLVLMESWCGDGAQTLPIMNKIAELSPNINFKIVLRDENKELMNQFLTNGGKSIPKLIFIDQEDSQVLKSWGSKTKYCHKNGG